MAVFERFVGKSVKVCFNDGGKLRVKHGTLVSASDGFVILETPNGDVAISVSEITKIQEGGWDR